MRAAAIVFIIFFSVSSTGWSKTYEWVDDKGTVNFTQDYQAVPEKYRDGVKEREDVPGRSSKADGGSKAKEKHEKTSKGSSEKATGKAHHAAHKDSHSKKDHKEEKDVNRNRIELDAADALKNMVSLWKDERYEALYECGTESSRGSMSREEFAQQMRRKKWGLASSWETLRDLDARFQSPKLVHVTARIGHRSKLGGSVRTTTETYPMKLEKGTWKTDLSKFLKDR